MNTTNQSTAARYASLARASFGRASRLMPDLNVWLLALNLVSVACFQRIQLITGYEQLSYLPLALQYAGFIVGLLAIFTTKYFQLYLAIPVCSLILAQSYVSIFLPALGTGIPTQDFLLMDNVSAFYSFDVAKNYLYQTVIYLPSVVAVLANRNRKNNLRLLALAFFGAAIANSLLAIYQGQINLRFWSEGSGTAVSARRAAGFLEDSAASSIYFAMVTAAAIAMLMFDRLKNQSTVLIALIICGLGLAAGLNTDSRLYPATSLISFLFLFGARILRGAYLRIFMLCAGVGGLFFILSLSLSSDLVEYTNDLALELDRVRAVQAKVMIKAMLDHPLIGSGFGTYYASYFENLKWALSTGGSKFVDPPSNFYLMLMSELGVAGWALCIFMLAGFCRFVLIAKKERDTTHSIMVGTAFALLVCFMVGIHIIFASSALGFAVLLAISFFEYPYQHKYRSLWWTRFRYAMVATASFSLAASIGWRVLDPPRQPAYRWAERGLPQVPLSVNAPIAGPGKGKWFSSGAELAVLKPKISIFVELPPEHYPLKVDISLFGLDGKKIKKHSETIETYQLPKPGRKIEYHLTEDQAARCLEVISPTSFCSFRVETTPSWSYFEHKIGFFVSADQLGQDPKFWKNRKKWSEMKISRTQ